MKLINKEEYQSWKDNNPDAYGNRCFTYTEEWTDLMEKEIMTLDKDRADKLSDEADYDGITGAMFGMSKSILKHCWVYYPLYEYINGDETKKKLKRILKW